MSRFLLYRGQSRYEALGLFADGLAGGLRQLGHEVDVLVLAGPDLPQRLRAALAQRPDAVLGWNGMGAEIEDQSNRPYSQLQLPYLALTVDHPIYLLDRLAAPIERYQATFVDHTHLDFARQFLPGLRPAFLPHAALMPSAPAPATRDLDIIFTGSYEDPGVPAGQWRANRPATAELFEEVAQSALANPALALADHYQRVYRSRGLPDQVMTQRQVLASLTLVDRYLRACWRKQFLQAFDGAGLTVDVYGHNWQAFAGPSRHRFHPPVDFSQLPALFQRARVVFAVGANFPTGSHERVLTAMASGAAAVTDLTLFYETSFAVGEDLLAYQQGQFDQAALAVRALLADPARLQQLHSRGPAAIAGRHDWPARAAQLLAILGLPAVSS